MPNKFYAVNTQRKKTNNFAGGKDVQEIGDTPSTSELRVNTNQKILGNLEVSGDMISSGDQVIDGNLIVTGNIIVTGDISGANISVSNNMLIGNNLFYRGARYEEVTKTFRLESENKEYTILKKESE